MGPAAEDARSPVSLLWVPTGWDSCGLATGFRGVAMGPAADAHGLAGQLWVWLRMPLL